MPVVLCIIGILAQQGMVALTTIAIASAACDVSSGIDPTRSIIVFCVLLASVSIPEMFIEFEKERSKYWFLNKAVSHAATSNYGATSAFFNKRIKTEKEPYIDTELWIVISDNVAYAADAFTTLINIIFNTAATASVLDSSFAVAIVLSGGISLSTALISFRLVRKPASESQIARSRLFSAIRKCIPNSWIGNSRCFRDWSTYYLARENTSKRAQISLTLARGGLSTLATVASTIPFIVAIFHYCLVHAGSPAPLTTLIAILPRQVSILQNINVIVVYAIQLSERTTRTALVRDNLILTNEEKRQHGLIKWDKLRVIPAEGVESSVVPKNMADIETATRNFSPGRTTLRGANGSGKSTLLALLKERLGDRAFLLPAHPMLYFTELDTQEASSGQAVTRILKLLESGYLEENCNVVLLDEWDANLDEIARADQDILIDDIAQSKCVIEVLHNSRKNK